MKLNINNLFFEKVFDPVAPLPHLFEVSLFADEVVLLVLLIIPPQLGELSGILFFQMYELGMEIQQKQRVNIVHGEEADRDQPEVPPLMLHRCRSVLFFKKDVSNVQMA